MVNENGQRRLENLLLYEKKVFPEDITQSLQERARGYAAVSISKFPTENSLFHTFVDKWEGFVSRLEQELQTFKNNRAETVVLSESMVLCPADDGAQETGDLRTWYKWMEDEVKSYRSEAGKLIQTWFRDLQDVFGDIDVGKRQRKRSCPVINDHIVFGVLLISVFALSFWQYSKPREDCAEGHMQCILKDAVEYLSPVYFKYLRFHNITFENRTVYT